MEITKIARNIERAYGTLESLLSRYEDELDKPILEKIEYVMSLLEDC